ncbi:histidine utilization repressor [Caulobacter sp. 17J65-9]|uniref:histidine utilization repressor n=1 Tax=Caulobacter sp. 17J65-9 TaxID=2709382 RepID=UPI0013C77681|nr:histidine utilization repressor [Caulobacter sp. 17J65-9]NEX91233.1 histidine utilization repressor [Caulobacter sp. 17J65-9]
MSVQFAAEPLYASIKKYIVDAVHSGELKPGDKVPSESTLVERFNVSRMTVNRALRELKDEGVLVGVAGVGSFVADPSPWGHLMQVKNIADEVKSRGHEYFAKVVKNVSESATKKTAPLLGVATGTRIFHSVIVHYEKGLPIQLEDRLVLAEALPEYGSLDFSKMTPNEYLMKAAPLQRVDHRVRAVMPDAEMRNLLMVDANEPCLLLVRQTWSRDRIVSHANLTHPGSRFEFSDSFAP